MKKLTNSWLILDNIEPSRGKWASITDDIRNEAQFDIISIDEVINTTDDISEAVPIILRRLWSEQDAEIVMGLCRAIMNERYFPLIDTNKLIAKYRSYEDNSAGNNPNGGRGRLAHLVSLIIMKDELDRIYTEFLDDSSLGDTRMWFLDRLNKYKANKKLYDYLVRLSQSEPCPTPYPFELSANNPDDGYGMINKAKHLLSTPKWKKFAESLK